MPPLQAWHWQQRQQTAARVCRPGQGAHIWRELRQRVWLAAGHRHLGRGALGSLRAAGGGGGTLEGGAHMHRRSGQRSATNAGKAAKLPHFVWVVWWQAGGQRVFGLGGRLLLGLLCLVVWVRDGWEGQLNLLLLLAASLAAALQEERRRSRGVSSMANCNAPAPPACMQATPAAHCAPAAVLHPG